VKEPDGGLEDTQELRGTKRPAVAEEDVVLLLDADAGELAENVQLIGEILKLNQFNLPGALLLRGNGALTLGATAGIAVARMWLLSAACDVYLAATAAGGRVTPLSAGEVASWRAVRDELLPRLWQHVRRGSHLGAPAVPALSGLAAREEEG